MLQSRKGLFEKYNASAYIIDFLLNVGALLFATTLYSSNLILLNAFIISPAALLYLLPLSSSIQRKPLKPPPKTAPDRQIPQKLDELPVRPFVTAYRGTMMVVTCIAILAVDFRIFPRRFAKVETWGTSLMDMGVGSFVFSAGLVSARPILSARIGGQTSSLSKSMRAACRTSAPLLFLGLIRLYSVKGLDYAEHVTEYGVHWNFFFTLALLPPSVALFQSFAVLTPYTALIALSISGLYQTVLELTRLKAYILTSPRESLLSQNREGVFSLWGYLSIFLAGQALGFDILQRNVLGQTQNSIGLPQRRRLLLRLAAWSGGWTVLYLCATSFRYGLSLRVSRRLANCPYVLWVAAFNCAQNLLFCLVETVFFPGVYIASDAANEKRESHKATSKVLKAFNRNGLAIFLLANLLTGLVNLTLNTLTMGAIGAMGVLIGYVGVLTVVAVTLDHYNLSVKL